MKKIAGLLLLTAAVILTAGCVTTADPILGSWQTAEPIQYDGFTLSYLLTFTDDGTGEAVYAYSDAENDYVYPILWEKIGDTYQYEMLSVFTFSEDGKTVTDYGYTYVLSPGEEKFGGVWTEVLPKGAEVVTYYTYVFNEDGTGVETIYETGEEPDAGPFVWEEFGENQISIRYLYTYSFEDGKMKFGHSPNVVYEYQDGVWVENPQVGEEVTTYEFRDDGICVRLVFDGETEALVEASTRYYTPMLSSFGEAVPAPFLTPVVSLFNLPIGGTMESAYIYDLEFLEDGTLQDIGYGEILKRVSPA